MATGSLTDSPGSSKNYQAIRAFKHTKHRAAFPRPAIPRADYQKVTRPQKPSPRKIRDGRLQEAGPKRTDSQKPAMKSADSQKPAKTATTKATPHNGDKTGCGHSEAHYPRSPRRAWLQEAVRDGRLPFGSAL